MTWLQRLPVAFGSSLGLLSLPAVLLLGSQASLDVLTWLAVGITVVLGGMYVQVVSSRRRIVDSEGVGNGRVGDHLNPVLLVTVLVTAVGMIYLYLATASTWSFGDNWSYLRYIRHYLDQSLTTPAAAIFGTDEVSARGVFNTWGVLQAFMDRLAGVEPVDVYSFYLPPLLLLVSLLAFYSLAYQLFQRRNIALLATLLQMLYYISSINSHDWIGRGFFDRIGEDKFLIWLIILPITVLLMLQYVATGQKRYFLPLLLCTIALGLTHPVGLVQWGISFASFAFIHLLFNWRRDKIIRLVAVFIPLLLFLLVPWIQRQMMATQVGQGVTFGYATGSEIQIALSQTRLWVFSTVENRYMAHPHLVAHPLTILAILLTPLLIQYLRPSIAAQFLFANMAAPLLLLYNPITAPLLGKLITPWMLWRISWLLPVALTISFFLHKIGSWLEQRLLKISLFAQRPYLLQALPVLAILLIALPLSEYITTGLSLLRERRYLTMTEPERDLLVHLREYVASGSVIMAEPEINTQIPAFISSGQVLTFRWIAPSAATEDINRFYQGKFIDDIILGILERWSVSYIIIERQHELTLQLSLLPSRFSRRYQNEQYELYEILPEQPPNNIITGNSYLSRSQLDQAEAAYRQVLARNPADTLAHFGLGQVYQIQRRGAEAKLAYEQAIAAHPGNVMARLALAELYLAGGRVEAAIGEYQEAGKLWPNQPASFEALGDLYLAQGQEAEAFKQYERAVPLGPNRADYYLALGDLSRVKGLPGRAITAYQAVIALEPRSDRAARAYAGLGRIYQAQGRLAETTLAYQQLVSLASYSQEGYTRLAYLYLAEGRSEKAPALYQKAIRHNLNLAWPHLELGRLYLRE